MTGSATASASLVCVKSIADINTNGFLAVGIGDIRSNLHAVRAVTLVNGLCTFALLQFTTCLNTAMNPHSQQQNYR